MTDEIDVDNPGDLDKAKASMNAASEDEAPEPVVLEEEEMNGAEEVDNTKSAAMEGDGGELADEGPKGPTFFADDKGNLKFVNMVVKCPCIIFWFILILCIVLSGILFTVVAAEGNPFALTTEMDVNDIRSIQYDSLRLAQEEVADLLDIFNADSATPVRRQSEQQDITYWVFEGETPEGVFGTAEAIGNMKEAFDLFLEEERFDQFCFLKYPDETNSNGTSAEPFCDIPISPLALYYASEWDSEKVDGVLDELKVPGNVELFNDLALCYIRGLFCEQVNAQNNFTQDNITWAIELGSNLTEISSTWDMKGELVEDFDQVTELAAYLKLVDIFRGLVDFGFDNGFSVDNQISKFSRGVLLWGGPLDDANLTPEQKEDQEETDNEERKDYVVDTFLDEMNRLAKGGTHDKLNSYYFMGSLIMEVLLQIVQQDGMLAIFSLVFVFIWIRVNTDSFFLAFVGILEIFFSIPVAWFFFTVVFQIKFFAFLNALSIFIVAAIGADDIFIFMDAYKQSAHRFPENLVSLETRMSWVYRRTGFAMAITSATTCAAFLCTLITPLVTIQSFGIFCAFVILLDYVLVMTLFCTAVVIYHDRFEGRSCFGCCCTDCSKNDPTPTEVAKEALATGTDDHKEDRVSIFFRTKVADFILKQTNRIVIAVLFLTWISIAIWQTTKIEAVKEAEQFLDENHPLQKSFTILGNEFPVADDDPALKIHYAWGLGEVDRSGVSLLLDPDNSGTPVFLGTFDFNEQCQSAMVDACTLLKTDPRFEGLIKRSEGVGQAFCFMEELAAYNVRGNLDDCEYVRQQGWKNETWQVSPDNLAALMDNFLDESSCAEPTETISTFYNTELGWDGQTLRYASISVESEALNPFSQEPEGFVRGNYDQFVDIAEELDNMVSGACSGGVIMTDLEGKFVFMNNQAIYVQTAVQASILGVAIAFFVLLLATRVLHLALFASLSIASVLVSVTGSMVLLGWQLGSIESILIGIIAGFSVDYVVHLAHAYETARGDTAERLTAAFGDMGISVLNGMITSVAASIPLFFCQLQFFAKFGTFLCLTIAFSWVFANFVFMSTVAQLKIPIKDTGCRL